MYVFSSSCLHQTTPTESCKGWGIPNVIVCDYNQLVTNPCTILCTKIEWGFVSALVTRAKMVPGGRVELPTPAFSGPRSTGELPRHRGSKRFYGRDAGVSIKDWISSARRVAQASACVVLNCDACCFASEKQKSKTHRLKSVLPISSTRRTRASNLSPSKLRAALFHRRDRRFRPS